MKYVLSCLLALAFVAQAQPVQPHSIQYKGDSIRASFSLTDSVAVDLLVEFQDAVGVNAANFDITAEMLDPLDPRIVDRLENLSLVSAEAAFPVIVSIKPKAGRGFSFAGEAEVELYTKALHYTAGSPLRVFRSHANGQFVDITQMTGAGSIRARGTTGNFSDFMILTDLRSPQTVMQTKFARLESVLQDNMSSIDMALGSQLQSATDAIGSSLANGNYSLALVQVDGLLALLEDSSADAMPDVWRSSDDLVNVKGELLTMTRTLRFSLRIL